MPVGGNSAANDGQRHAFYPELESLRGVAAMCVVVMHTIQAMVLNGRDFLGPDDLTKLGYPVFVVAQAGITIFNARAAVLLFFVLSGFVMSLGFDASKPLDISTYSRFLIRRFFRLMPALWASAVLALLMTYLIGNHDISHDVFNWFLLRDLSFNPPSWTLVLEIAMCLIYPLLLFATRSLGTAARLLVLVLIVWQYGWTAPALHYGQVQSNVLPLLAFYLGLIVPTVGKDLIRSIGAASPWIAVASLCVLMAPELVHCHRQFFPQEAEWLSAGDLQIAVQFACFYLIAWIVYSKPRHLNALLNHRSFRAIGRWSYSIYVLHFMVLFPVYHSNIGMTDKPLLRLAISLIIVIPSIIALAALSYRYIERPCMMLGGKLAARLPSPVSMELAAVTARVARKIAQLVQMNGRGRAEAHASARHIESDDKAPAPCQSSVAAVVGRTVRE